MSKIRWFFKLCGMTLSMCWRGYINYLGWSALVHGIGLIVGYLGDFTVLFVMIHNFSYIGGFTAAEVCLMYAMSLIAYALGNIHTRKFWEIDALVQRGELDQYLVRPVSPLLQLFVWDIQVGYVSHLILGCASIILMKSILGLTWGLGHWLVLISCILSGSLIMGGISIIATPLVFWWGRSDSIVSFLRWDLRDTTKYPMSIFPDYIRRPLYVIPYAFVSYLPCIYLFEKSTEPYVPWIPLITMSVGVAINALFWVFWRIGLRRYNSAGG